MPSCNDIALNQIKERNSDDKKNVKQLTNKLMAIDFQLKILVGKMDDKIQCETPQGRFMEVERAERRIVSSYSVVEMALHMVKFDHTCPSLFSEQLFSVITKLQASVRLGNSKKLGKVLGAHRLGAYASDMIDFF